MIEVKLQAKKREADSDLSTNIVFVKRLKPKELTMKQN